MKWITILVLLISHHYATAQNSVLSSGQWYKIGLTESGIYKIGKAELDSWGINSNQIDPRTIKVFGNGGNGILPQSNATSRPEDLIENSILGVGTEDGTMSDQDYFLFYGNSPHKIDFLEDSLLYETNFYCDTTYYFITYGGEHGKRVQTAPEQVADAQTQLIDTYFQPIIHETDQYNLINSGRRWVGEQLSNGAGLSQSFSYDVSGFTGNAKFNIELAAQTEGEASFDIGINSVFQDNLTVEAINSEIYSYRGTDNSGYYSLDLGASPSLTLEVKFNRNATALTSIGYIDQFYFIAERSLSLQNNQLLFWNHHSGKIRFQLPAGASTVWDITNITNPKRLATTSSSAVTDAHRLLAFNITANFSSPTFFHEVANQNIKTSTNIDALIITAPLFKQEADALANFHQNQDGLSVSVVSTRQIYNEFSSGMQDLTAIRDYIKYIYDNGSQKLKYVLLYGDGSFDYKNKIEGNTNHVPIYESRDSFHSIYSYSSDDYIGFLESNEGEWIESRAGDHTLEVGIGRLPIHTREEAQAINEKLIRYATSERAFGNWRNKIIYISDDGDDGDHMLHGEILSNIVEDTSPETNIKKLYLDAYTQDVANREESAQMQEDIRTQIREGALVVDYMGHGNELGLMQEGVITTSLIRQLDNRHKLPLFVTATCEFGRYDNPKLLSGAELLLLNESGGAIGLLTTTRPVFAHTNLPLNEAFHYNTFSRTDGLRLRLGDIIKNTKNEGLQGRVNRNFALLGDPMLTLNYADFDIIFDQLEEVNDTLSALETVNLTGRVVDENQIVSDFTGSGVATLYDIPKERTTKGQQNDPFVYDEQTNALFRGDIKVENGRFETSFIIPKNTSYQFERGKINAYFFDSNNTKDASGGSNKVILGGTSDEMKTDNIGPNISLYVNENVFKNGVQINQNNLFIAKLSDESGINISENGFNQNLSLTLNDSIIIVLNDYYTASSETFQKGAIVYPMQNLKAGSYSGELKVWDTYNNSSSMAVEFKVSDQPILTVENVIVYPNPVRPADVMHLRFSHDREGDELDMTIGVYDLMGNLIIKDVIVYNDSPQNIDDIEWQPSTTLSEGQYILRVHLESLQNGASNDFIQRLVIIN